MATDDNRILVGARILMGSAITAIMTLFVYGAIGITARAGGADVHQLEIAQLPVLVMGTAAAIIFVMGLLVMTFGVPRVSRKAKTKIVHDTLRPSQREN